MRCGQSLQKRCMPGVGKSKIQPGRPRIREVLGRSVAPVAIQLDDKRAGGRVDRWQRVAHPKAMALPTKVLLQLNTLALTHRKASLLILSSLPMLS